MSLSPQTRPLKRLVVWVCACATLALTACANPAVQAWEKGDLARPEMTFADDVLTTKMNEQTYASREAAAGGAGVGGGGCGCN